MLSRAFATATAKVPLTVGRFPGYVRDARFAKLNEYDVNVFKTILAAGAGSSSGIETGPEALEKYNTDWLRKYRGMSSLVLKPKSTQEVSKILKHCNERRLAVVPQGGNTGLVGGGVPLFDEIVLSTERMTEIESFDNVSGILKCQAGCILENLDKYVAEQGFIIPLDLGAKGSCHIGGNVATNAGGLRLLRYGSLHGSVLGLEVVLADGTILDNLSTLRKDNTGYDLKQLMIGSEGTLGVITKIVILTPQRSKSVKVAVFGCQDYTKVQETFKAAKQMLGEILSACEFFDAKSLELVEKNMQLQSPLEKQYPFYVLIETSGSNEAHDAEKLNLFLDNCFAKDIVVDGVISASETQNRSLWKIRESIPEAIVRYGMTYKYDLSLPVPKLYDIVEDMRTKVSKFDGAGACGFGHLGDGNLHLNVFSKAYNAELLHAIEPYVYEFTAKDRGSISAEHGLGLMKAPYLSYSKDATTIEWMRRIKNQWDPSGILNPYKYLPPS